ncbi:MAG: DUF6702 family protein, partial [Bacteroidota bacterium]
DDLDAVLMAEGHGNLYLGLDKEKAESDSLIQAYFAENLRIEINGQAISGKMIGKEVIDDVIWSYLEFVDIPYPQEISVENRLLLDQIETQQNIVHIKVNGQEKSLRLVNGRSKEVLKF